MNEFLMSLIPWGTEAILWVQSFSNPFLDALLAAATLLGDEEFYLIFLPLIYWCFNKRTGIRLAYVVLLSTYLNLCLKDLFGIPRPDDARIRFLRKETTPSFPSGHAQGAVVTWGYLASQWQNRAFWAAVVVLVFLTSLSRVYLGVHFPQDVVGGIVIGVLYLLAFNWVTAKWRGTLARLPLVVKASLSVLFPIALVIAHPTENTAMAIGALSGMGLGFLLEDKFVGFSADGLWWKRVLRFLVGLILVIVFYVGLKAVFPTGAAPSLALAWRAIRYGIVGVVGTFVAPWVFVKATLAEARR
ncbi:MAG: phosphatase PAP2 family protein [Anaerolineales bacterium]|nr:phosphatase PAP2 family protein [Anaerolineales bacterium]